MRFQVRDVHLYWGGVLGTSPANTSVRLTLQKSQCRSDQLFGDGLLHVQHVSGHCSKPALLAGFATLFGVLVPRTHSAFRVVSGEEAVIYYHN